LRPYTVVASLLVDVPYIIVGHSVGTWQSLTRRSMFT
jgi:hypothetical protein